MFLPRNSRIKGPRTAVHLSGVDLHEPRRDPELWRREAGRGKGLSPQARLHPDTVLLRLLFEV
eukprot:4294316-Pyramimonas_sp.AAC.1